MRLVYIAIGWVAGLIIASNFNEVDWRLWWGLMTLMLITSWLVRASRGYRILMISLLMFSLGGLRYATISQTSQVATYNNTGGLTIEGIVRTAPDVRDDRIQFQLGAESVIRSGATIPTDGKILVQAPRIADVSYGDRVRVTGELITPAEFDTFSYADFLAREGVYSILTNTSLEVISSGHGNTLLAALFDLRTRANDLINTHLPEPQAGLLAGILLGNERGLSPELNDDFSAVGASHVIAISGFNMVIIAGVVMGLLNPGEEKRWWTAILGILVIAVYTLFVGANAAVLRAAIMSGILIIGSVLKRKTYVPASLAFVALLMSVQNPNIIWDISFQLSFFATLGLALFVDPLKIRFDTLLFRIFPAPFARQTSNFLSEPLIVTIAAQITTLPLIILYFNRVSLVSLIVNLLIIPLQTPLLIIGGLATIIAFIIPTMAQMLYWIDLVFLSWTIGVVRSFAKFSFAEVEFSVHNLIITGYFTILLGWAIMYATRPTWWLRFTRLIRRQIVMSSIVLGGLSITILIGAIAFSRPDGKLHVRFFELGHGNAVFIETPNGAQILIDGGRFPSRLLTAIGDNMPFTDRTLEVLIITHPDEFDYSALLAVTERYDVEVALTNGQSNLNESYAQLLDNLVDSEIVSVQAGYTLEVDDGVLLEVLHPQNTPDITQRLNDHVMVLRLTYGDISILLTSDLSENGQITLMEAGNHPLATVLQLPQHGTVRSLNDDFLAAVQPQAIIVQADPANRRGDPNPDTLALIPAGIPIFRTDIGGDIHLWTDGTEVWVIEE